MHYEQAGDTLAKGSDQVTYDQEIEVVNRPDALYIRHHFSNLSERRQEIVWPATSVGRSCHLIDAVACDRLDENRTAFLEGENQRQSITYEIPKNGPMGETALYHEPFADLYGSMAETTLLHFTDETDSGGLWVNSLNQVGRKKMDHVDYALYRGTNEVRALYWQRNDLPLVYEGEKLSVYGKDLAVGPLSDIEQALATIGADHSTLVIDPENSPVDADRFIVSGNSDVDKVSDLIFINNVYDHFSLTEKQRGTAEVIASITSGKAVGTDHSRRIYRKLLEGITSEELGKLQELLKDKQGHVMDEAVLDELIGEVTGFKTSYFKRNMKDKSGEHPFLFEDPREVVLDGTVHPEIRIILKDGKTFYPANELLSLVGYSVTSNERSIYIESPLRQFRFPKKELFYVYNDRKFDVVTMPFELLDGAFYFEESWFKRLFLFSVDKTGDAIDIDQISTMLEEVGN